MALTRDRRRSLTAWPPTAGLTLTARFDLSQSNESCSVLQPAERPGRHSSGSRLDPILSIDTRKYRGSVGLRAAWAGPRRVTLPGSRMGWTFRA